MTEIHRSLLEAARAGRAHLRPVGNPVRLSPAELHAVLAAARRVDT